MSRNVQNQPQRLKFRVCSQLSSLPAQCMDQWQVSRVGHQVPGKRGDAGSGEWAAPAEDIRLSADFGKPSRGPALLAGVGLGWYRDMKPFWRKRCALQTLAQWMESASSKTSTEDPMSPGSGAPQ